MRCVLVRCILSENRESLEVLCVQKLQPLYCQGDNTCTGLSKAAK